MILPPYGASELLGGGLSGFRQLALFKGFGVAWETLSRL